MIEGEIRRLQMIRGEIREKQMAFGQGVVVTGGLPVIPCSAMRGNSNNRFYITTTLCVALIRT